MQTHLIRLTSRPTSLFSSTSLLVDKESRGHRHVYDCTDIQKGSRKGSFPSFTSSLQEGTVGVGRSTSGTRSFRYRGMSVWPTTWPISLDSSVKGSKTRGKTTYSGSPFYASRVLKDNRNRGTTVLRQIGLCIFCEWCLNNCLVHKSPYGVVGGTN